MPILDLQSHPAGVPTAYLRQGFSKAWQQIITDNYKYALYGKKVEFTASVKAAKVQCADSD